MGKNVLFSSRRRPNLIEANDGKKAVSKSSTDHLRNNCVKDRVTNPLKVQFLLLFFQERSEMSLKKLLSEKKATCKDEFKLTTNKHKNPVVRQLK